MEFSNVTLISGTSFLISDPAGDVAPAEGEALASPPGLYGGDTRLLSRLQVLVDGQRPRLLRWWQLSTAELATVASVGDPVTPELVVSRRQRLDPDLVIELRMRNCTGEGRSSVVRMLLESDFRDLSEVRRATVVPTGLVSTGEESGAFALTYHDNGFRRRIEARAEPRSEVLRDGLRVQVAIPPHGEAALTIRFGEDSHAAPPRAAYLPSVELRASVPDVELTLRRSVSDLAALTFDDDETGCRVIGAGVPWFMALFGRDSLLSSWAFLPVDPDLVMGCLRALARRQGRRTDSRTEEQPGRIMHEQRRGRAAQQADGWGSVYYGTVDATPLFVMALHEAWRWGAERSAVAGLLDAAEAAVAWMSSHGDLDRDGFVEYDATPRPNRLVNQGWKDSHDGIRGADGGLPTGPIALVEVQAFCHAALLALAELRAAFGTGDPAPLRARAAALHAAIDDAFWMEAEQTYAVALDGHKQQIASVTSNPGWLLWAGAARPDRARLVAARLLQPDCWSGFGLRTLSADNPAYNPMSYHCGSVWSHDAALVAAGLYRYGCVDEATVMAEGLLAAAGQFGGRLPELFGGFSRAEFPVPVPYPVACAPQAWAAGAPILLLRAMLGLEPDMPAGRMRLRPRLPGNLRLSLDSVRLAGHTLSLRAEGETAEVTGAGDLELVVE